MSRRRNFAPPLEKVLGTPLVSSADLSGKASVFVTQFQACRCEKRDLNLTARQIRGQSIKKTLREKGHWVLFCETSKAYPLRSSVSVTQFQACHCEKRDLNLTAR